MEVSGAAYDRLKVRMHGVGSDVSSADLPRLRMLQYADDGTITDITSAHTATSVEGTTQHNSIFAVAAPVGVFAKIGPVADNTGKYKGINNYIIEAWI